MLPLVTLAALHAALAFRTGAVSYEVPVAIGWLGVLLIEGDGGRASSTASARSAEWFAGVALAAVALGAAFTFSSDYHPALRFSALLLGAGWLLARSGLTGLGQSVRQLALLALPLLAPPPLAVRIALGPQRATLHGTATLLRVLGHPVGIAGDVISTDGGAIEVLRECAGVSCMSQLAALALLLVCLFETTRLQKAAAFAVALAAGFVANCGRLALLALLAQRDRSAFEFWHSAEGELRFVCAGLLACAIVWWLMLRGRPAAAPAPQT